VTTIPGSISGSRGNLGSCNAWKLLGKLARDLGFSGEMEKQFGPSSWTWRVRDGRVGAETRATWDREDDSRTRSRGWTISGWRWAPEIVLGSTRHATSLAVGP
jgi:hypothetical protein